MQSHAATKDSSSQTSKPFFDAKPAHSPFYSPAPCSGAGPAIQTRLSVGAPGDRFEREADAVADQVVQRKAASVQGAEAAPSVQAKCAKCEHEETVQRQADGQSAPDGGGHATDSVQQGISAQRGAGQPLDPAVRREMEQGIGADFSNVRIHTGAPASDLNDMLHARAFTHGRDVFFNAGEYDPGSSAGRHLLAHELAHVVQQRQGGASDASEARASAAANQVAAGGAVPASSLGGAEPGGLHCDPDEDAKPKPEGPQPLPPFRLPPLVPPMQLQPPQLDWLKMRQTFDSRGLSMNDRDGASILAEWQRGSRLLDTLGMDDKFKFWFIDKPWLLNLGISMQLDQINARDNPNAMDRFDREWKNAYPDEFRTPMIPIFDLDWFRKGNKK